MHPDSSGLQPDQIIVSGLSFSAVLFLLKNQPNVCNGKEEHQYEGRVSRLCWNWSIFCKYKLMIKCDCRETNFLESIHLKRDINTVVW